MHQASTSPTQEMRIIRNLGHLGHYLYITRGCRGGQQFILTALYRDGDMTQKRSSRQDKEYLCISFRNGEQT